MKYEPIRRPQFLHPSEGQEVRNRARGVTLGLDSISGFWRYLWFSMKYGVTSGFSTEGWHGRSMSEASLLTVQLCFRTAKTERGAFFGSNASMHMKTNGGLAEDRVNESDKLPESVQI